MSKKRKQKKTSRKKVTDRNKHLLFTMQIYLFANMLIWLLIGLLWLTFYFTLGPDMVTIVEKTSFCFLMVYCLGLGSAGISILSLIFRS